MRGFTADEFLIALQDIYDEVWASFVEDRTSGVAETQSERERLAHMIVELARERQVGFAKTVRIAGQRMREHVPPTRTRH